MFFFASFALFAVHLLVFCLLLYDRQKRERVAKSLFLAPQPTKPAFLCALCVSVVKITALLRVLRVFVVKIFLQSWRPSRFNFFLTA